MYSLLLAFITAFGLTYIAIPSIIHIAIKKGLVDVPGERRSHTTITPSLGGVGIFAGTIFSIILWTPFNFFGELQYILCAFIIIFLIGVKDDIDPISPRKKLIGQVAAAFIIVFKAKVVLSSLYGIFGINELPLLVAAPLSIFTIIVIINAFNLIDGINGLSGSISVLISVLLGYWFFKVDRVEIAIVAFAMAGSVVAFLKYNITPAKIFMGDTGSLLIGLVCSILVIEFIDIHRTLGDSPYAIGSTPAVAIAILILPLFDTARVFAMRLIKGRSPFSPDRLHIHHLLLDSGFSHMKSTTILVTVNIAFILIAYLLQDIGSLVLLVIILTLATVLSGILYVYSRRHLLFEKQE
jgi:UDP-N-acetylmuramyl pentapeptide phosphotransferase/UDP-N-acetylglucosamine-1-phosphate transferase